MIIERESSLEQAEQYVLENLKRETFESRTHDGDEIEVDRMNDCDCVPNRVEGGCDFLGYWKLVSVRTKTFGFFSNKMPSLSATYRFHAAR